MKIFLGLLISLLFIGIFCNGLKNINTQRTLILLLIIAFIIIISYSFNYRSYFNMKHPILVKIKENFAKINPMYQTIPIVDGDSSYTENKETITLCLVNPENGKYYDMNTLMYVALHELAHVITNNTSEEDSHGPEFQRNFDMLLKKAKSLGFYNPNIPIPSTYCNVKM